MTIIARDQFLFDTSLLSASALSAYHWRALLALPTDPQRVADYYPLLRRIDIKKSGALVCYSQFGNSLIAERGRFSFAQLSEFKQEAYRQYCCKPEALIHAQCVSTQVTGFTDQDMQQPWFTLDEDWLFIPLANGRLLLIKIWLNFALQGHQRFRRWLPMPSLIRCMAKLEHRHIQQRWALPIKSIH